MSETPTPAGARQLLGPSALGPVRSVVVEAGPIRSSVRKPDATFCVRVLVGFALLLVLCFCLHTGWKGFLFLVCFGVYFIVYYLRVLWPAVGFSAAPILCTVENEII